MAQRILGVDPGTLRMGYGLVDAEGRDTRYLDAGALTARASLPLGNRLVHLHRGLLRLVEAWSPTIVAIEDPFVPVEGLSGDGYRTSVRSAIAVGQAQAVALMAAATHGLPVFRYPPAKVKRAVSGGGRNTKEQVAEMVRIILGLAEAPRPADATDALAVALCHLQEEQVRALL